MKWLISILLPITVLQAQNKINWDTTRYQKFRTNLIVGIFQSYRNFDNTLSPKFSSTAGVVGHDYVAESTLSTGIDVNFDKVGFSLGVRSRAQDNSAGKGHTKAFSLGFNTGGNRWFLESNYRSFVGFYDANTPLYDTNFKHHGQYRQEPNLTNQVFKSKFFFFSNHKRFAFRSSYVANYRQLRSSGTWILSANLNYNNLHNNAPIFSESIQPYFLDHSKMRGISVVGVSANAGAALTIVIWRSMFLHLMFIVGPEQQWRTYSFEDKAPQTLSYLALSGDFRAAWGFNWKRAYLIWNTTNDFAFYNNSVMTFRSKTLGGSIMLGWRFNTKVPKLYQDFQKTKLYTYL